MINRFINFLFGEKRVCEVPEIGSFEARFKGDRENIVWAAAKEQSHAQIPINLLGNAAGPYEQERLLCQYFLENIEHLKSEIKLYLDENPKEKAKSPFLLSDYELAGIDLGMKKEESHVLEFHTLKAAPSLFAVYKEGRISLAVFVP